MQQHDHIVITDEVAPQVDNRKHYEQTQRKVNKLLFEEKLYLLLLGVLKQHDGLCLDTPEERKQLALALQYAITGFLNGRLSES